MAPRVKVCGVTRLDDVSAAVAAGVSYLGFNFFPKSPRFLTLPEARALAIEVPVGVAKVALYVDPTDAEIDALMAEVPIDILQLHGKESAERVVELRARTGLPVMKVVGVSEPSDITKIDMFSEVADMILVDAKAPKGAVLPGGNGVTFDWRIIADYEWRVPWMLAGGLTPDNVAQAARLTGATQLDVASGVEEAPGIKDPAKMQAFVDALKA